MRNRFFACLLPALAISSFPLLGDPLPTGTPVYREKSYPEITLADLRAYLDTRKGILFDARDERAYGEGHIPGAVLLPAAPPVVFDRFYAQMKTELGDKSRPIVVYCTNRWCPLSDALYDRLVLLGYTQVVVFRDGLSGWQGAGLSIAK